MVMTCDRVRELASGFVLGALDPDEMIGVSDHLDSCPELHPEVNEMGGLLPYLAESLEPIEPPAWLRESVIAAAKTDLAARVRAGELAARPAAEPVVAPVVAPAAVSRASVATASPTALAPQNQAPGKVISFVRARASRRRRVMGWMVGAAAAVAVLALSSSGLLFQGDFASLARAQKAHDQQAKIEYALTLKDTRTAVMAAADGSSATGIAALRPTGNVIMTLHGLTATKGDQVYVVWLSSDNGTPVKVGSFTVDDSGEGGVEVDNVSTSAILWLFVCREPNGNVTKPTGPMVVSGTVSL
jgi:hypothetical protein